MTSKVFPRTVSRMAAIQATFQHFLRPNLTIDEIIADFLTYRFTPEGYVVFPDVFPEERFAIDQDFFSFIAKGAQENSMTIENLVVDSLPNGWSMEQMEHTTRSIFRCAGFEIQACQSTPKGVILNEYIITSHCFLLDKGHGLVNAVLDKIFQQLRPNYIANKDQNRSKNGQDTLKNSENTTVFSKESLADDIKNPRISFDSIEKEKKICPPWNEMVQDSKQNRASDIDPIHFSSKSRIAEVHTDHIILSEEAIGSTAELGYSSMKSDMVCVSRACSEDTNAHKVPTLTIHNDSRDNLSSGCARSTENQMDARDDTISSDPASSRTFHKGSKNASDAIIQAGLMEQETEFVAPTTLPSNFKEIFLHQENDLE